MGQKRRVIGIHFRQARNLGRVALMMRQRVMCFGHADFRICASAEFAAEHERDHPRQIALIREYLQIEHQFCVLFERRRHACRLVDRHELRAGLFLGFLNPALEIPHSIQVFLNFPAVTRRNLRLKVRDRVRNRIENAAIATQAFRATAGIRASAVTEQPLEYGPRIVFHGQWRGVAAPGDRIREGADVFPLTRTRVVPAVKRELER